MASHELSIAKREAELRIAERFNKSWEKELAVREETLNSVKKRLLVVRTMLEILKAA
jgi:hypothetical protein